MAGTGRRGHGIVKEILVGKNRPALYVVALFVASYAVQGYIWRAGGLESPAFRQLAPVVMFFPGLAALVYLWLSGEGWRFINWRFGRPAYLLYGLLIPAITALLCVGILTAIGLAESPHLAFTGGRIVVHRGPFLLGTGEQSVAFFTFNFLATAVALGSVNGLVAVGEEVGWRGFLQPKLVSRLGLPLGVVLLGLIWAHWHTPIILLGYNFPETPVLGAFVLWPATCVFLSFVFAWLTINGDSLWPAVVGHGSYNAFHGGLVDGMSFPRGRLLADLIVLGIWLVTALLAFGLITRRVSGRTHDQPVKVPVPES